MSFRHFEIVAHVDPLDPALCTVKPIEPKIIKPLDFALVEPIVARTGRGIEAMLYDGGGYLVCEWTMAPRVPESVWSPFLREVSDATGAMILNQYMCVYYPEDSAQVFKTQSTWKPMG